VVPADARLSRFDAQAQSWQDRLPSQLASPRGAFPMIPTGESAVVNASTTNILDWPSPALRIHYYHQDHLGSSSVLSDSQGGFLVENANYPFGHHRVKYQARDVGEPYGFTQKETDAESKFVYFDARYLASSLSRFLSADPAGKSPQRIRIAMPQDLNSFSYAMNSPLVFSDPTGNQAGTPSGSPFNIYDLPGIWNDVRRTVLEPWVLKGLTVDIQKQKQSIAKMEGQLSQLQKQKEALTLELDSAKDRLNYFKSFDRFSKDTDPVVFHQLRLQSRPAQGLELKEISRIQHKMDVLDERILDVNHEHTKANEHLRDMESRQLKIQESMEAYDNANRPPWQLSPTSKPDDYLL